MMESDQVSMIVRTMGRPELVRALDSLAAQTYPNIEIVLVVANPSFDPQVQSRRLGLTVVAPGARLMRPDAANAGLRAASGRWIGFLDEDDWLEPAHVANLVSVLDNARGPLLAYSDMIGHELGGTVLRSLGYWKRRFYVSPAIWIITALFSRRLVDEFGCAFDSGFELLEDWDFFVQCAEFSDCLHVRTATAHYDAHAGGSGGGSGINRDDARLRPYIEQMTRKWGLHYGDIIARADQALAQADDAIRMRDWRGAEQRIAQGLAIDPGNPHLLNRWALCRREAGDGRGTLMALRRACDSDRDAIPLLCDLAQLEHSFGFREQALAALARLRELASSKPERARVKLVETALNVADD